MGSLGDNFGSRVGLVAFDRMTAPVRHGQFARSQLLLRVSRPVKDKDAARARVWAYCQAPLCIRGVWLLEDALATGCHGLLCVYARVGAWCQCFHATSIDLRVLRGGMGHMRHGHNPEPRTLQSLCCIPLQGQRRPRAADNSFEWSVGGQTRE